MVEKTQCCYIPDAGSVHTANPYLGLMSEPGGKQLGPVLLYIAFCTHDVVSSRLEKPNPDWVIAS